MHTYRDRVAILTWVTAVLLAVQPVFLVPRFTWTWYPFGTPLTVVVGRDVWLGGALMLVVMAGTQWVLSAWDVPQSPPSFIHGAWALPLAEAWIALRLLPRQETRLAWLVFFVSTLLILALTWHSTTKALGHVPVDFPAPFILRTLAFATAGTLYLWLYSVGERSLLSATQMLVGSYLLAAALWQDIPIVPRLRWLYSLVVGLIVGQMAWLFRHVALSPLQGGLLLLLIFYGLTVILERHLERRLTTRLLLELAVTAGGVVLLILLVMR